MKNMAKTLCLMALFAACMPKYPGEMDNPQPATKVVEVKDVNSSVDVENGIYDLELFVRGTEDSLLLVSAGDKQSTILLTESVWEKMYVRGIEVKNGKMTITCKTLETGATYEVKTAYLKAAQKRELIKGGDLSMLSQVEKNGGKYYDENNEEGDCFEICKRNGMNLVRLRLYNDPGNEDYYPSKTFFKGIQDEQNILDLAKRAKAAGMQIELTFHYSDSWTNGGEQYKPHEWQDVKSQEELGNKVYEYTKDFLQKMVSQGTAPEYVSLGNEIQAGLLFGATKEVILGEGENTWKELMPTDSLINGYCDNLLKVADLLNQGSKAVREICPEAKIIIHLTTSSDVTIDTFKWFCSGMRNGSLDYDIIGASYYPFYGNKAIEEMIAAAENLCDIYDKDFIFMETGFAWNSVLEDGSIGQIANNDPYKDMTPEAQRRFLLSMTEQINSGSGRILGYIYWDPIYIAAPNCGWAVGEKNVTGNSTLFDFSGQMLSAWDAMRYN